MSYESCADFSKLELGACIDWVLKYSGDLLLTGSFTFDSKCRLCMKYCNGMKELIEDDGFRISYYFTSWLPVRLFQSILDRSEKGLCLCSVNLQTASLRIRPNCP